VGRWRRQESADGIACSEGNLTLQPGRYKNGGSEPISFSPQTAESSDLATMRLDTATTPVLTVANDNNGNTLADAQGRSYTWDFENRLTQAIVPGTNGGTMTFRYDPWGRRIQKSGPLGTTNYLYDGPDIIEAVDTAGNVSARNTKGPGIDETLATLRSGATSYYDADGLGSVTSLSDNAGSLSNIYTYDSHGKLISSGGTLVNPFQYAGREFDAETGLYYYRDRYYDATTGRFLSEDPLEFEGGDVDLYRYVANDPVMYIDPDGLGKLPGDPSGLGPQWTRDPTHLDPNGERWRNPNGDYLDFHRGRPGQPGERSRDHWHYNGCKRHLKPGEEVPTDTEPAPKPQPDQPKAPDNAPKTPTEPSAGPNQQQTQNAIEATGTVGTVLLILYYLSTIAN